RKKLTAWGIYPSDADKIIRRLEEMKFVDDARFARAYAHDKLVFSGWGRNKIIQGLWAKRLDREYIDASMDEIEPEEYESVCRRVIRSKIRLSKDGLSTYESKMKILRYAVQRGFEARLAGSIINWLAREEQDDD
ncbi:MAG: RecX family transcriptional regulator, partial [Duncaniella sp.]|nr:RecX family transcriptional regulator [Duncaniella sp.]